MDANASIVLVDDDPDLLRLLTMRLSAAGYRIYDQVAPMALDYERRLLAGFSAAERATLADLLERLDEASRP